jgi:selenocysteine lyase/cysteine desulfurase
VGVVQDLVFVSNATTGLNTIISSTKLQPGDTVYSLNIGYGSVKKMLARACEQTGARHVEGEVVFPTRWEGGGCQG